MVVNIRNYIECHILLFLESEFNDKNNSVFVSSIALTFMFQYGEVEVCCKCLCGFTLFMKFVMD
jgi:hypothetical protein